MTDDVYFGALLPGTRAAISAYYEHLDMGEIGARSYWSFERGCELFFRLKYADDTPELFPHGKWATLQVIEQLLADELAKEQRR